MNTFINSQFLFSLISGLFIGGTAAYLGSLMLTKRMALVGDALGHVALPGMGLALLFGLDISLGAFSFLFLGVILIWLLEIKTSLPTEALIGIAFVTSLAVGFLIVPDPELLGALFGDISKISLGMAVISAIFSISAFLVVRTIYPKMVLANISNDLAKSEGIEVEKYNFIYLFSIAAIIALGIKIVGSLLIGALLIVPPAAARNLSSNLRNYCLLSIIFGILSSLFGILLFKLIGFHAAASIILVSVLFFIISLIFKIS